MFAGIRYDPGLALGTMLGTWMGRQVNKLSARTVETLRKPGRHSDGGNLYLNVKDGGSKSWLFIYRFGGRQREMGLGDFTKVSLARAREFAQTARAQLGDGIDPLGIKQQPTKPTFGERADAYIKANKPGWKNEKHIAQWEMTMREYAAPIRGKRVDEITSADIVGILEPIWLTKHDTATKVRQRIEAVLNSAKAMGFVAGDNPALKSNLKDLLPKPPRTDGHFAAMAISDLPDFMTALRARSGISARALEFTILTAARTSETIGATWGEFDDLGWIVPPERMKGGKEHRVPLSARALEIVKEMREGGSDYVFSGAKKGSPLSTAAMSELLKGMKPGLTVHGFRSTFRDWTSDHTSFSRDVCEMALAHAIESKTEAAYRRSDLYMKRLDLMEAWEGYCSGKTGKVLPLAEQLRKRREAAA